MKLKLNRDLIILFILIPLFLAGAFFISNRLEDKLPDYSVINKSRNGYSILYEGLRKLDSPVERTLEVVEKHETDTIQLVPGSGYFDINRDEIKSWIEKGGTLVYLTPGNRHNISYGIEGEEEGNVTLYHYGKGLIMAADGSFFTNRSLAEHTGNAYSVLKLIYRQGDKRLFFNETHLFAAPEKSTPWDFVPVEARYILYQLVIIIAAFFYYKGKRFGKPIPFYEEAERNENEYLYSAASLYRAANCFDIMLEGFYKSLLKDIGSFNESWLDYWERQSLPSFDKAKKVYEFMNNRKEKLSTKEYIEMVTAIDQLRSILKKRREGHWKTLKRTT
jgi:hypothetical protein